MNFFRPQKRVLIYASVAIISVIISCLLINRIIVRNHARQLISAIDNDNLVELEVLLNKPISPNGKPFIFNWVDAPNTPPLVEAVMRRNHDAFNMLIEYGADINVCDAQKNTALHYAALFEEVDIVQTLINNGAIVNCKNELGYIPLEYMEGIFSAYSNNQYREKRLIIAKLLLDSGSELFNSSSGVGVLFQAARGDDDEVLNFLFSNYDIDINIQSKVENQTALMYAAMRGSDHACIFLIQSGADVSLKDTQGKTAYDYAIENGYYELAEMISTQGTDAPLAIE